MSLNETSDKINSSSSYMSSYETANSTAKDELIDKMQEKFGQMLTDNQRIGEYKAQNEVLRSTIESLETKLSEEREKYKSQISSLELQNHLLSQKNIDLMEINSNLEEENSNLKAKIEEISSKIVEERRQSDAALEREKTKREAVYALKLSSKNQEISDLKSELQTLSSDSLSSSKTQNQESKELKSENSQLASECDKCKNNIRLLSKEIEHLHAAEKNKKEEIAKLVSNCNLLKKELEEEHNKDANYDKKIEEVNENLQIKVNELHQITEILPQAKSIDEYVQHIKDMYEQIAQLQSDLSDATGRLKKAASIIRKNQESITGLSRDIESERLKGIHLQKVIDDHESKNEKLITQIKALSQTRASSTALINAFKLLCKQLDEIDEMMDGKQPSLKPLITTIILVNRWHLLVGTQQFYVNDQRNWWWLTSSMHHHYPMDTIITKISKAADERNSAKQENSGLKNLLLQTTDAIKESETALKSLTEENCNLKTVIVNNEKEIKNLNKRVLEAKESEKENQLVEIAKANNKIEELKEQITTIEKDRDLYIEEYNNCAKKLSIEVAAGKKTKKECEFLCYEIEKLREKLRLFQKEQQKNDRDMLAVERMMKEQKEIAKDAVQHGFFLAKQNQKLTNKVTNQKKKLKTLTAKEEENNE